MAPFMVLLFLFLYLFIPQAWLMLNLYRILPMILSYERYFFRFCGFLSYHFFKSTLLQTLVL